MLDGDTVTTLQWLWHHGQCLLCSGLRLKAGSDMLPHTNVRMNAMPEKEMFLPPHHFLQLKLVFEAKITPALVFRAGS